jgi:CheY-like chemotaxis protein
MRREILVVEDDPALAAVMVVLFDDEGYAVRRARDGNSALQEIERAPPDLVVSDISMPGIDGVRLSEEIRRRGMEIPIVLVSAVVKRVRVPGVIFIPKPFDVEDLLQTVSDLFDKPA